MKFIRPCLLLAAAVCFCLTGCSFGKEKDPKLTKVTLNEVTREFDS